MIAECVIGGLLSSDGGCQACIGSLLSWDWWLSIERVSAACLVVIGGCRARLSGLLSCDWWLSIERVSAA
jgi:hypothetical protein